MSTAGSSQRRTPWMPLLIGLVLVAGLAVRLTVRDAAPWIFSILFYATPRPVLLGLGILGCLSSRTWRGRSLYLVVSLLLGGWMAAHDFAWPVRDDRPLATTDTIIFWNVGRNLVDDYVAVDEILETEPAVVGIVETGRLSTEWLAEWQSRHPNYTIITQPEGLLMAVRGEILAQGYHRLPHNSHVAWIELRLNGRRVRVALVDIVADIYISREMPVLRLTERLAEWDDRPLIVMGDFNTPVDSAWMTGINTRFQEAFLTAGEGYVPTWPVPLPVLKLDQIWLNSRVQIQRAWQTSNWRSDHRAQWAEVSVGNE